MTCSRKVGYGDSDLDLDLESNFSISINSLRSIRSKSESILYFSDGEVSGRSLAHAALMAMRSFVPSPPLTAGYSFIASLLSVNHLNN